LIRWHRKGFRLFWKWKSRPRGRPRIPADLQKLIAEMAVNNSTWGEERIADELLLKIGIRISPRTIRRYMPRKPKRPLEPSRRWMTFVRNHAKAIISSDFFVVVTATFQLVYVFVIMEIETRRILHFNVTRHPNADWTLQQFRECICGDEGYRFVIHDRDRIYSRELDASLKSLGVTVLKTPYKSPQANAFCERLIGSARRDCLDFMIPFNEAHVRKFSSPGRRTTTGDVLIPVWAREYQIGVLRRRSFKPTVIRFLRTVVWLSLQFSAACITTIAYKKSPHDNAESPRIHFCGRQGNMSGKGIEVDLRGQRLLAFEGDKQVVDFTCFTGDGLSATDAGRFSITWKDEKHVSSKYHRAMPYAMFFTADGKAIHAGKYVGVRSTAMRSGLGKLDKYIPDELFKIGSHGCVNLTEENAKKLYDWAPEGTQVIVW